LMASLRFRIASLPGTPPEPEDVDVVGVNGREIGLMPAQVVAAMRMPIDQSGPLPGTVEVAKVPLKEKWFVRERPVTQGRRIDHPGPHQ